jgi:hypothetical protein
MLTWTVRSVARLDLARGTIEVEHKPIDAGHIAVAPNNKFVQLILRVIRHRRLHPIQETVTSLLTTCKRFQQRTRNDIQARCNNIEIVTRVRDACEKRTRTPELSKPLESLPLYSATRKTYLPGLFIPSVIVSGFPPLLLCEIASKSSTVCVTFPWLQI